MNGSRVSVGVVGLGYWGPNLARNFSALADCELAWCCDADPERRARFADQFRSTRFTDEAVLAGLEHRHRQRRVRRHRRGEHDRVERRIAQQVIEFVGEACRAKLIGEPRATLGVGVAAPGELAVRQRREVAREVRPPVSEADDADAHTRAVHGRWALGRAIARELTVPTV